MINKIGWGGVGFMVIGGINLPAPYSGVLLHALPVWGAAFAGYSAAIQSPKQVGELLNQATLVCLGLALVVMLFYGEASYDEWGNEVSEGFETTFDSKAGAGMRAFFKLIMGSSAGILLAEALPTRQEK